MKTGIQVVIITALLVSIGFLGGRIVLAGAVSTSQGEQHSVVKGDTLWDVTGHYLRNPFFWPKVWQYNPQIENPHLIYPGDRVRIPSPEELARMGVSMTAKAAPLIQGPIAYVGGYLVERDLFESSGFILPRGAKAGEGVIVSSWDEKSYLTDRDVVHVNLGAKHGVKVSDLFQVIHVGEPVVHPVSRVKIGKQATVQGILKITAVDDNLSTATIIKAYDACIVGDSIRAYHPQPLIGAEDLNKEDKSIQGVVVKNIHDKAYLAVRDMVYIDVGTQHSVTPGDRFVIYRSGVPSQVDRAQAHKSGIRNFPVDITGELVVLKTMDDTATAVVVEELYEITPGDRIKYTPRSLPPIKKFDINEEIACAPARRMPGGSSLASSRPR